MNKVKCLLLVNILGMLFISVPIAAEDSPDVKELLRRFAEARENFTSFIFECEATNTFNYPQRNRNGKRYSKLECRFDGNRGRTRVFWWGNVDIRSPNVSKNQAHYTSDLWDGENYYSYNRGYRSDSGHVMLSRGKDPGGVPKAYKNRIKGSSIVPGQIMGYPRGDNGKRIDEVLYLAESLELRQEKLRGVDCYVIEAVVKGHGKYTVWIDPTHDYHLAKIHIHRKENDYFENRRAGKKDSIDMVFEVLHFEQIGDLWFPKQCKLKRTICDNGDCGTEDESINITNIVLNPDHDALKSFIPDDIPNGATANIVAFPPSLEFIWQDGKVVTDVDEKLLEQLDAEIEKIANQNTMILESKTRIPSATLTVSELLKKYAETQDKLKSFIVKSEDTLLRTFRRAPYQRLERWHCDFRTDGERIHFRANLWIDLASEDEVPTSADEDQLMHLLWDGKRYIYYRTFKATGRKVAFINTDEERTRYRVPNEVCKAFDGGARLLGIIYGDSKRVDSILRQADSIFIRDEMEKVGSVTCYVVDASTKHGSYTLWFDPEHGYNIAKAYKQMGPNDLFFGRPFKGNTRYSSISFSMENVRFKQMGSIWIPVEADSLTTFNYPEGGAIVMKWRQKRTQFILNPDHEVLGSFVPMIEDGTRVYMNKEGVRYEWQNGKPVASIDEAVTDQPDQMAEEIMTEGVVSHARPTVDKPETSRDKSVTIADTKPEMQVDVTEPQRDILTESRSLHMLVLILIGLLIIVVIAWLVFRRLKT